MQKKKLVALFLSLLVLLSGCSSGKQGVISNVEGEDIRLEDFEEEYEIAKKVRQEQFGKDIMEKEIEGELYEDILKEEIYNLLVDEVIIAKDLERLEIGVTKEEVEELSKELREARINELGGEKEYEELLKSFGLNEDYIKKTIRRNLVLDKHLENFLNKAHVEKNKIQSYYDKHGDEMKKRLVSHILVESEEEGKEVLRRIKEEGADFHELAVLESVDTSTVDLGGEIGYVGKGELTEIGLGALEEPAFQLEVGQISDLIESDLGYHVIYVENEKKSLEDLQGDIVNIIKYDMYIEHIKELKENADIKTYMKEFK